MFNSPLLEVAIGMIFFYLLLSLICTSLNELIEAWLKNRASDLENGIRRLLDDEVQHQAFLKRLGTKLARLWTIPRRKPLPNPAANLEGLALRIYDHALVRGLYLHRKDLPSYIPARNFALALMDLVAPGGAKGATASPAPAPSQPLVVVAGQQGAVVAPPAHAPAPAIDPAIQALRTGLANNTAVPSEKVRKALLALIDAAGNDPAKVRQNVEDWYNSSMDRVSGWYKRRTQIIILVLGFLIAIVLNADSVIVMDALWNNSALRSATVQQAENLNAANQKAASNTPTAPPDEKKAREELERNRSKLASLGLPIGWNSQDDAHKPPALPPRRKAEGPLHYWALTFPSNSRPYVSWSLYQFDLHWLGWFVTGLAISLGAPFWFDLLNRFIVVRSTVKPQEKSPEEGSKA